VDIAAVMDEVAEALGAIPNLRVFAYFPDRIVPPVAVVDFPKVDFDATFSRGSDQLVLPVTVLVSRVDSRSARDRLLALAGQVKAAIEGAEPTSYDSARVTEVEFNHSVALAAVEYAAATFSVDIIGSGS
jgi:hypothetical protein